MENIFVEFLPPWVETGLQPAFYDKESGTVLQQTARMYARVNMLIRMFNKLSKNTKTEVERFETAVNEDMTQYKHDINVTVADYIEQFNQLHDYVHDYFDNLDVQEEINNKLDEMTEQGILQEIITTYIQSNVAWTFDTVADMKAATNLVDGSYAQTLGYYEKDDCGGAIYKIRTKEPTDIENDGSIIFISDTLLAELNMKDGIINTKQFGCLGDGVTNDTTHFQNCLTFVEENHGKGCIIEIVGKCLIDSGCILQGTSENYLENIVIRGKNAGSSGYINNKTLNDGIIINIGDNSEHHGLTFQYTEGLTVRSIFVYSSETVRDGAIPLNKTNGIRIINSKAPTIEYCNFNRLYRGLYVYGSGLLYIQKNNFSLCNAGCWLQELGDSTLIGNYFNTNGWNIRNEDGSVKSEYSALGNSVYGLGLWCGGVGMTSIIGGKCEWNDAGMYFGASRGIVVSGVNFDYDCRFHIGVTSEKDTPNPANMTIENNNFISGGHITTGSYLSGAQIAVWKSSHLTITGNTFMPGARTHYNQFDNSIYYGPKQGFIRGRFFFNSSVIGNTFTYNKQAIAGDQIEIEFANNTNFPNQASSTARVLKDNRKMILSGNTLPAFITGSFEIGDLLLKNGTLNTGWVCTDKGSYGNLTGTTCNVVNVDTTIGDFIVPGDATVIEITSNINDSRWRAGLYINIDGVSGVKRIIDIVTYRNPNRLLCRLDSACDVAVTNAAVSLHSPTFTTF